MSSKNKKKFVLLFCFAVISFIINLDKVFADYSAKVINTSPCQLYYDTKKKQATGSCMYSDTTFKSLTSGTYWVDVGDNIKVITSVAEVTPPKSGYGSECKSKFTYISIDYNSKTYNGYVCKDQIWDGTIPASQIQDFKDAGFPESYYNSLAVLKISHPKWNFIAIPTQINFSDAVAGENYSGKSLIQYTSSYGNQGYLSTADADYDWINDKFIAHDGSSWYQARKEVIEYMMDPRNSLSDMYIFQFETLAYVENPNNLNAIKTMLNGQYIYKFSENFLEAGKKAKVNPVYLASLSKQEIGGSKANTAVSGESFTYGGKTYKGYYNFYNIGATSAANPVINGLWYATGKGGAETSYNRPWNTEDKAILGGAQFIANSYIQYGQSTSYFKKWNVVKNYAKANGYNYNNLYTHQYMTNIEAPRSEAKSTYNSYKSLGTLDDEYTFFIPVYNNMPASTSMPSKGNPNNYLSTITISENGSTAKNITGFKSSNEKYEMHVENNITNATITGTTINSNASIVGTGKKNLNVGNNVWTIVVTAQNGDKKTYTVNVIRDEAPVTETPKELSKIIEESNLHIDNEYLTGLTLTTDVSTIASSVNKSYSKASVVVKKGTEVVTNGNLTTGMTVTISNGDKSVTYTVVIYGDLNGDGIINALDLLKVQKHILGVTKLSGASLKAADSSKDNNVNALDLLKVQKHILGIAFISQE